MRRHCLDRFYKGGISWPWKMTDEGDSYPDVTGFPQPVSFCICKFPVPSHSKLVKDFFHRLKYPSPSQGSMSHQITFQG
ncbi:hypothetical protein XELAEV_18016244mg [Xenopus laevis]|uniref:Uncharacterized protein n=1 Tax=Xenopus laevis TaxID=8355 RepID=A0A974DJL5_XENLA|nr:hypothetical protein XELAEV_18016244mg [Xenopus laevis]